MEERAGLLGGIDRDRVAAGGGTVIRARIPSRKRPMEKITVLIVDDHAVLRAGLRMLIGAQPDMAWWARPATAARRSATPSSWTRTS
jgi:hypothetical protein